MATEAHVNIAPPEHSTVTSTAADSFVWQPDSLKMHVIRPKSAKGRTRPRLPKPQGTEESDHHTLSCPSPANSSESPSSQKLGVCAPTLAAQGTPGEIPELLQQVPIGASSSLNKYPVLPSINRRSLEEGAVDTAKKASSPQLSSTQAYYQEGACSMKTSREDSRAQAQISTLERKFILRTKRQGASRAGNLEEPSDQEPRLLLAVRSPSGQRFVRHFRPTDDLQTVVAVAEQKNRATYGHCSIETMEVPRRRFSDLTKSLQECRIPHMSVLGITQEKWEGWP
ncbi:UBX domain-containing protein 10 [Heterocephalus glaber]|uniref:UBX domain-containing protein 10 n=1 Tax=Heterocephalus glaber TaxID=10181 RepID=A0A0P6J2N5_HETGA|nr:UBX domain-containing protein 10 [Heterocephalus glaber]XP_021118617.1 UBX domain-containing protein 10 [Heterocephalus glaber]